MVVFPVFFQSKKKLNFEIMELKKRIFFVEILSLVRVVQSNLYNYKHKTETHSRR